MHNAPSKRSSFKRCWCCMSIRFVRKYIHAKLSCVKDTSLSDAQMEKRTTTILLPTDSFLNSLFPSVKSVTHISWFLPNGMTALHNVHHPSQQLNSLTWRKKLSYDSTWWFNKLTHCELFKGTNNNNLRRIWMSVKTAKSFIQKRKFNCKFFVIVNHNQHYIESSLLHDFLIIISKYPSEIVSFYDSTGPLTFRG